MLTDSADSLTHSAQLFSSIARMISSRLLFDLHGAIGEGGAA